MSTKNTSFLLFTLLSFNLFALSDAVVDQASGLRYSISGKDVIVQDVESGEELARFEETVRIPEQILVHSALETVYVREKNQIHALKSRSLQIRSELKLDGHTGRMELSSSGAFVFVEFPEEQAVAAYDAVTSELISWHPMPENFQKWFPGETDSLLFEDSSGNIISAEESKAALSLLSVPPPPSLVASAEFTLSQASGGKDFPSIDFDSAGHFVSTWTDLAGNDGSGEGVYIREFSSDTNPQYGESIANTKRSQNQGNSTVGSTYYGEYVTVWRDDNGFDGDSFGVFFRRFGNGGLPKDPNDIVLANTTNGNQKEPSVDVEPDGDFVAVWTGPTGNGKGVFARRFNSNGSPKSNEQIVGTSSELFAPDIATNPNGRFVVVWRDGTDDLVRARVFDGGTPITDVFKVDNSPNDQFAPSVGMDENGNFVVSWQQNSAGGIQYRRFDKNGNPREGSRTASQDNKKDYAPSLSISPAGQFCIAWRDENSVAWARSFQGTGDPNGDEFKPSQSGGDQFAAACGVDAYGNFAVAWKYRPGGGDGSIRGRMFGSGAPPPPPPPPPGGVVITELTKTSGKRRGSDNLKLSVKGSGFQNGAIVSFYDPGIRFVKIVWKETTRIKIVIDITKDAFLGPHHVTVINPDGSSATVLNLFEVKP